MKIKALTKVGIAVSLGVTLFAGQAFAADRDHVRDYSRYQAVDYNRYDYFDRYDFWGNYWRTDNRTNDRTSERAERSNDSNERNVTHAAPAVTKEKVNKEAEAIVKTAKSYLGKFEYDFGNEPWNSNNKYSDCSAFVQLVFNKKHGYDLPRVSRNQAKEGTFVKKANLQKGDLVFFDTNNDGKINHVGIYIGNGDFIHSAPSNDVGINSLESGSWEKYYETARRVIK